MNDPTKKAPGEVEIDLDSSMWGGAEPAAANPADWTAGDSAESAAPDFAHEQSPAPLDEVELDDAVPTAAQPEPQGDMLDAWQSGPPDALTSVHAEPVGDALERVDDIDSEPAGGYEPTGGFDESLLDLSTGAEPATATAWDAEAAVSGPSAWDLPGDETPSLAPVVDQAPSPSAVPQADDFEPEHQVDESSAFDPTIADPQQPAAFEPEGVDDSAPGFNLNAPPIKSRGLLDKRKLLLFGGIGGTLILFAILSALQPQPTHKKGDPNAAASNQAADTAADAPSPDITAIQHLPSTYTQAAQQQAAAIHDAQTIPANVPKLGPKPPVGGEVGALMVADHAGNPAQQAQDQLTQAIAQQRQQAILKRYQLAEQAVEAGSVASTGGTEGGSTTGAQSRAGGVTSPTLQPPTIPAMPGTGANPDSANRQDEKNSFLQNASAASPYLTAPLIKPASPNVVQAGTLIPIVFLTGINSDLPGQLTAQVSQPVYDSPTGASLLIPQGTRLIGQYDSRVTFGQERVLLVWTRMIFPNGSSISLEGMPGVDMSGYAGVKGHVNNHWGRIVSAVLLSSVLSAGAAESQGNVNSFNTNPRQMAVQGAAQTINQSGNQIVERQLDVQPTLTVEPGSRGAVMVDKDIALPPYTHAMQ